MADILIIEDDEPVRSTIRSILELGGHGVREASDGEEGLAVLRKQSPDLVLCDITMPRLTGYEVLKEVRARNPQLAELPFLFLSAHAERGDILEGLGLGADDYLTKPVDQQMLLAKVEATLRQVARMQEKKTQEQVKLYKALSRNAESKPIGKPAVPRPERRVEAAAGNAGPTFDQRLQEAVARGAKGSVGKVHFANLSALKQRLGERWEKVARTATGAAESVVKRHLNKGAVSRADGSNALFILFPELSEEEASLEVDNIVDEICIKLLGEGDAAYREISLAATARTVKELLTDGDTPTLAALTKAFERQAAPDADRGRAQKLADRVLDQATVKYLPIWRPETERVLAYQACACLPSGRSVFPTNGAWREGSDDPLAGGVRFLMAERVAAYLKETAHRPGRASVCLPIHLSTLIGENRQKIAKFLDEVPLSESRNLLMIELIVPPTRIEARVVSDVFEFVKRRSRLLAMRCSPDHPQTARFVEGGAQFLSLQFAPQLHEREQGRAYQTLRGFAQEANALGLEPYVLGLDTVANVRAAMLAGFRIMAGRAIAREQDRPREAYSLPKKQFLTG